MFKLILARASPGRTHGICRRVALYYRPSIPIVAKANLRVQCSLPPDEL